MDNVTLGLLAEALERINIAEDVADVVSKSAYSSRAAMSDLGACCDVLKEYIGNTSDMLDGILSGVKITERKED